MIKSKGKLAIIIIGAVLIVAALLALIIASVINGNDFLGMFTSKWAYIIYVMAGLYILCVGGFLVWEWIRKNG